MDALWVSESESGNLHASLGPCALTGCQGCEQRGIWAPKEKRQEPFTQHGRAWNNPPVEQAAFWKCLREEMGLKLTAVCYLSKSSRLFTALSFSSRTSQVFPWMSDDWYLATGTGLSAQMCDVIASNWNKSGLNCEFVKNGACSFHQSKVNQFVVMQWRLNLKCVFYKRYSGECFKWFSPYTLRKFITKRSECTVLMWWIFRIDFSHVFYPYYIVLLCVVF